MINVNTGPATRDLARLVDLAVRALPPAAVAVARAGAGNFVGEIERISPRDTNRFVAGWARAAVGAGVDGVTVPVLVPSKYRALQRATLYRQLRYLSEELKSTRQGIVSLTRALEKCGYTSRGRPLDVQGQKWTRRLADLKLLEGAYKRLHARAQDQIETFNSSRFAVVFGLGAGGVFSFIRDGDAANEASGVLPDIEIITQKNGRRRAKGATLVVSVRDKVYGGDGRLVQTGDRVGVILHNLEAHSTVVQFNSGAVTKALEHAGVATLRDVKSKVVRQLTREMRLERQGAGNG